MNAIVAISLKYVSKPRGTQVLYWVS